MSGGASHGVTVADLSPDTQYLFTVQAHNPQGHSSYVTPQVAATTRGKEDLAPVSRLHLNYLFLVTTGSVLCGRLIPHNPRNIKRISNINNLILFPV